MENKKFIMSYSLGKDSTLSLHKMIADGYEPYALMVMFDKNENRSFFHGATPDQLKRYEDCLGIPMIIIPTIGENYHLAMEAELKKAKANGVEFVCFGDIDIQSNRQWGEDRCKNANMKAIYPLWQKNREENVYELINLGYKCVIKSINNTMLPKNILGKIIDSDIIDIMKENNIDICGENGEYHTLAVDGPIFKKPISYEIGAIFDFDDYSVVEIK